MNIASLDGSVAVTVSRRNLEQLLASLDQELAGTTIVRNTKKGVLSITAEEDDVHYDLREEGPGGPGLAPWLS